MIDPNNLNRVVVSHAQPSQFKNSSFEFTALGEMQIDNLIRHRFPHRSETLGQVASCVVATDEYSIATAEKIGINPGVIASNEMLDLPVVEGVFRRNARFQQALAGHVTELLEVRAPSEEVWIASPHMVDAILRQMGQKHRDVAYGQAHVISFK